MSMKNPLTPAGIEPETFRFVAQRLNHCATAVPPKSRVGGRIINSRVKRSIIIAHPVGITVVYVTALLTPSFW